MKFLKTFVFALLLAAAPVAAADTLVINLWPESPPGPARQLPPESDLTKDSDQLIAGRRIIKLGNVSTPQIAVYPAPPETACGAAVVVCPGGGHHILAYDLEGTEVAEWLNSIGVTAIVLKYRVPLRNRDKRWDMAVQDGQRAISLVRANAEKWKIDPARIGILGFSAGGELAGRVSTFTSAQRQYKRVDQVDDVSCRPDVSILVYSAGFVEKDGAWKQDIKITSETPPAFFVHAWDDRVNVLNPLMYAAELKKAGVQSEVHLFAKGGHGYGLRHVDGMPVTDWPVACTHWLGTVGMLGPMQAGQ